MATKDEVLTETDDDEIDVVEVDAPSGEEAKAAEAAAAAEEKKEEPVVGETDDDDDDGEHEDARLAERDESEEDSAERKKRLSQRQRMKAARDRAEQRIVFLENEIADLKKGQNEIRSTNLSVSEGMITSRLEEVRRDIATAESILADAVKNSDGDSYATALRLRDEAKAQEADLVTAQRGFEEAKKQPTGADPDIARFSSAWKASNPWYRTDGSDNASAVVNAIDAGMIAEGLKPNTREYWSELTRRVSSRLATPETRERKERAPTDDGRKKGPPIGDKGGGGNGNGAGRKVFLSKERVDAIKQAGDWDDPKERAKAIKAYEAYDRDNPAQR